MSILALKHKCVENFLRLLVLVFLALILIFLWTTYWILRYNVEGKYEKNHIAHIGRPKAFNNK